MIRKTWTFVLLSIVLLAISACELSGPDTIALNEDFETEYELGSSEPDWLEAIVMEGELSIDDLSVDASDVDFDTPGTYDVIFFVPEEESLTLAITVIRDYVIDFSIGHSHVLALTYFSRIHAWGNNGYGQLGNGQTGIDAFVTSPLDVTEQFDLHENERIVRVFTGQDYSFALTDENRLFSWGMNWSGQLGDATDDNQSIPQDITANLDLDWNERILDLRSDYHSIALTSDARLISWGWNENGQLANGEFGHSSESNLPLDVTDNFPIEDEDAIAEIRINRVLTENGHVYAWGENDQGQVGDDTDEDRSLPIDTTDTYALDEGERIRSFSDSGMIALTGSRVLVLGYRKELGPDPSFSNTVEDLTDRFELSEDDRIRRVTCGRHWLALSALGRIYSWGPNTYGQLGIEDDEYIMEPIDITDSVTLDDGETVVEIRAGTNGFSIVLTSSGRLFSWGRNNFGQLGVGTQEDTSKPTLIAF